MALQQKSSGKEGLDQLCFAKRYKLNSGILVKLNAEFTFYWMEFWHMI